MCPETITVRAPAKINLFLEVLSKRPDGYHEVRSIIVPISIFDVLSFRRSRGVIETTVKCTGIPVFAPQRLPTSESNLATRAAQALKKATGYRGGAHIHIRKGIPIAGGLGGGSADAAATLKGLNRLWRTGLSAEDLIMIGRNLGSDVPAMVHCGLVFIHGMGDRVEPVSTAGSPVRSDWWVVVANPGFGVSTRDICTRYRTALTSSPGQLKRMFSAVANWDRQAAARGLFNSLEGTVFSKYPLLEIIRDGLRSAGAGGVLLSGSGASVFGFADNEAHARRIEKDIGRATGPWLWTKIAKVLPDGVTVAHGPLEARV